MTHRQTIVALSGLLLAMFAAFLSATIVSNALPTIISVLHGSQNQYTWIVTATLLSSTATTPIWGKLSDLYSKKLLVQISTVIFTTGSLLAGFSPSVEMLIVWRSFQGLGLGGLQALVIIAIAAMISPRERGRYMGPIAAVMSVAPVAGPLIGGVIVDTDWLGWRWCFWAGIPLAMVSLFVVHKTLHLPVMKRKVSIDWLGASLIVAGVCDLLIWVTLAGNDFAWGSGTSIAMLAGGLLLLGLAVVVELRAAEPVIPLRLFRDRTTTLATIGSLGVGVAMFGGAVFLIQYFQIARGVSPTAAGLLMLPTIVGSTLGSTISGALITRTGKLKVYLVVGSVLLLVGFAALATIDHTTNMVLLGAYLFVMGAGTGTVMQNLVLAVQNVVPPTDLGSATSTVSFFRSLGGTVGVSVLGAVLATQVADRIRAGLVATGADPAAAGSGDIGIGQLNELPGPLVELVRIAYGDGTARIFLVGTVLAVITLISVVFLKETPLRTQSGQEQLQDARRLEAAEAAGGTGGFAAEVAEEYAGLDQDQNRERTGRHRAPEAAER
ncbi:MFS transporter [Nakamurella leprariae]